MGLGWRSVIACGDNPLECLGKPQESSCERRQMGRRLCIWNRSVSAVS
jgi:hypothetical protein